MENVIVVGASSNEERYSNKAMKMLSDYGHTPIPVAPKDAEILGRTVYASVTAVPGPVDTVTLYVGPQRQDGLFEQIIGKGARRVIFNPGTENPDAYERLRAAGIEPIETCTLVLLRTGQF
ncbi:CoA-binding protein [uncultured Propionivibrio sp.]|uniref:CoA-binding protein n=1 Tax=uncultured Propionivibrio sp. TaxID=426737 RepID=UPI0029BFB5A1|nr:CoA-binding protein [uncultured Propionivibrio sp.]